MYQIWLYLCSHYDLYISTYATCIYTQYSYSGRSKHTINVSLLSTVLKYHVSSYKVWFRGRIIIGSWCYSIVKLLPVLCTLGVLRVL